LVKGLRAIAKRLRPSLLVVSAGYDFILGDPVGDLGVEPGVATQLGRLMREIADTYCDGRALFCLEGGYDTDVLAGCVADTIVGYDDALAVDAADPESIPKMQRSCSNPWARDDRPVVFVLRLGLGGVFLAAAD